MNRSKKPKSNPIIERGRKHRQFVDEIMNAVESGSSVQHEDMLVLVTEIRDLRARISSPST